MVEHRLIEVGRNVFEPYARDMATRVAALRPSSVLATPTLGKLKAVTGPSG